MKVSFQNLIDAPLKKEDVLKKYIDFHAQKALEDLPDNLDYDKLQETVVKRSQAIAFNYDRSHEKIYVVQAVSYLIWDHYYQLGMPLEWEKFCKLLDEAINIEDSLSHEEKKGRPFAA
jgi:hypothetical protein